MLRHGESVDDLEDCYGGIADFPLTDRGKKQAEEVGRKLSANQIQAIYCSPLSRASETAAIIAKQLPASVPITQVDDLQERNSYGVLSGVNKERAKLLFARVLKGLKEKPGYSREPIEGAEEFDLFLGRVRRAFEWVTRDAQARSYDCIAVVTHGKFTQALFEEVLHVEGNVYLDLSAVNPIQYSPASATPIQQ